MKFSLSWLKDHLETDADAVAIAAKLNAIGLEVEEVSDPAAALAGFRVARVLTAERHPNADKLQVLTVDTGEGAPLQVVCGAPNARAGLIGVLGLPGATVPANGMVLKVAAVRGVESNGMMCSLRELDLGEGHDGIVELPADAPVGLAFADYHGADPVFDVAITPNRPDCMGVYGIARDLAAAGLGTLKPIAAPGVVGEGACPVAIRVEDTVGCPAFYGRVIRGLRNGESPAWLQERLKAAGQRPISALVDLTNYLSLTYGRPAHVYDLAKLSGGQNARIFARRAVAGESLLALNGKDYALDGEMTVIADGVGLDGVSDAGAVLGIGGVMGGEASGCSEGTTDVLLEIAYFAPDRIAVAGRALNLTSDARQRFERGVDPTFLDTGLDLLTGLVLDVCGGVATEVVRAGEPPVANKVVAYAPALAETLGGVVVSEDEQKRILGALGFGVGADWGVSVPGWRPDVDGAADIVEEVVRIYGIDRVASVPLPRVDGVALPTASPAQRQERRVRRAAAARGLNEAVTWSFLPAREAELFADGEPWALANPISEDMKVMRPSLLPGLLSAARRNVDRGAAGLRLFEIGRRYLRGAEGVSAERPTLAVVLAGEKVSRGWANGKASAYDAFDAKAEALALLAEAGASVDNLMVMGEAGAQFHPGRSGTLRLGPKTVLARFGMLHPTTLKAFDIDVPVAAVEIYLDAIPAPKKAPGFARVNYAPPALQAVTRDFAFLLGTGVPAGDLVRAVKGADKAHIVSARVFDDFRGQGVPEGQKSLAIEVTLQPGDKTFAEADLAAISDKVVKAAAKVGASLRG